MITCDEIIDTIETKIVTTNFNEKNAVFKTKTFYNLVVFWLITISLLIAAWIYFYLIKHKSKQKHLLPYHVTNDESINDKLKNVLQK